jgi:hypothetical protein
MKTKHVISVAALTLASTVASAGLYQPRPVTLDMTNRFADGDMLTARNSLNPFEFIGCGMRQSISGFSTGFCQAGLGEAEGEFFTCFTEDPNLLDAIKALDDFSYIVFRWDVDGNCTFIGNSTQSFYVPDLKSKSK